ncbi:Ig-like domain repeat protein [Pseudomonas moraviensis subsp. stanleyae]|uniref:hypothetical protein n=1 Tax=Pseudomonas moraviensis TaxID=321662 RepID=UPI002E3133AD|nr:hypothetical protein [Pseudomonas moraviensis]MED7668570.1 Ig-like domain repeat protein [Pseudomonas moraviensis subsp. stanleyae]
MSVQVHSTEANAALALYPVYPPQWITPVLPPGTADGGLPLSAFTPSGVELVIDPITGLRNWIMAAYDVVTIFVNAVSTGISKTIYPGEEQERILLRVPAIWFTNGVNDVRYKVTRPSDNDADSPTLKLLYNNPAPTVTVSHPPSVVPGQTAVITITVGYPRPHDTVTLTIGTWSITFPNPTSPINHTLTAAELQLIGDGTHSVFATVRDQLTNNNESAKTPITITANQKVYNAPIIAEAVDGMLDVAALKGQDATLRARDWTGIQVGQQVWLKFTGQKSDGSAHVLQFWNGDTHKVNATWVSQGFWDKSLLIAFLRALKEGSLLKLEFWVSEDKSNDFASATRFPDQVYTVTGLQLDLPAPTLTPPTVPIDVLANPNGVKLQIKDFAAEKDDKAQFVQVNAPAGAPPFPVVDFVGGTAEILLSAAFLAAWHGKAIEFRWDLIRAGQPAGESAPAKFDVKKIADGDARFPTPNIAGNTSDVLDVQALMPAAQILAEKWLLFEPGQPIWVTCQGIDKNGNPVSQDVRSGELNDSPNGLSVEAPVEWLKKLKGGTDQKILVKVNLDGIVNAATAVGLPIRTYAVKAIEAPTEETFDYFPWSSYHIGPGESIEARSMLITNLPYSEHEVGIAPVLDPQPGKLEGKGLTTSNSKIRIRLDLKATYSNISFWCSNTSARNTATSYNEAGLIIETIYLPIDQYNPQQAFFTQPGINRIEIENAFEGSTYDAFYIDSFKFYV